MRRRYEPRWGRWQDTVIGAAVALIVTVALMVVAFMPAARMQRWPSTTGSLDQFAIHLNQTARRERLEVETSYSYRVNGSLYTGTRFGPPLHRPEDKECRSFQNWFEVKLPIQVYYDPADPAQAILTKRTSALHAPFGAVLFSLIAIGVGFLRDALAHRCRR